MVRHDKAEGPGCKTGESECEYGSLGGWNQVMPDIIALCPLAAMSGYAVGEVLVMVVHKICLAFSDIEL